jgi:hypothetical protein
MKNILLAVSMLAAFVFADSHAVTANIYGNNNVKLVEQSSVPVAVTGTAVETTLSTLNIPGNSMYLNGGMRIHILASNTNNANNKTIKLKLAGNILMTNVVTATNSAVYEVGVFNRGVINSQTASPATGNTSFGTGGAFTLTNVDMSKDQTLTVTCQLAVATDTCQLEEITVEVLNP